MINDNELQATILRLESFIDQIKQELIDVKDYQASSDCCGKLNYIASSYFGLCTKYGCKDRKNCEGNCEGNCNE
jgi:hypothetical protein